MINFAGEAISNSRTITGTIGGIGAIPAKGEILKGYPGSLPQALQLRMAPPDLSKIILVDPAQAQMTQL